MESHLILGPKHSQNKSVISLVKLMKKDWVSILERREKSKEKYGQAT